jgi:spermidine synthase
LNQDEKTLSLTEVREYHTPSSGLFFEVTQKLHEEQSSFQKIEIYENETFGKILFLDGLVQTSEKDEYFYHEMIVHPAFQSHPSPESCVIIGGGDGGTLREVLRHPVREAILVEIDSSVIEVCRKYFPWLDKALEDERAELVVADGNEFIEFSEMHYDIVLIDSSEPIGPSSILHEREFYLKLKRSLNPGGAVVAQVGSPFHHLDFLEKKARMLKDVYSIVRFYLGSVPTYPGGMWCYMYLSDERDPLQLRKNPPQGLKYYTPDIHRAAFALPAFMQKLNDQ